VLAFSVCLYCTNAFGLANSANGQTIGQGYCLAMKMKAADYKALVGHLQALNAATNHRGQATSKGPHRFRSLSIGAIKIVLYSADTSVQ